MRGSGAFGVGLRGGMAALAVGLLAAAGALEWVELRGLNSLFHLRGPRPPRTPVTVVSIDDDSFQELGLPWPWPRALHARLVDLLREGGALAVGLDLLFVEPSAHGPEDDAALADAVGRAGNVILAAALTSVRDAVGVRETLNPPLKAIRDRAAGFGPANLPADEDAFVRRALLRHDFQGREVPGLDLALQRVATRAGLRSAPPPAGREILINYRGGPQSFPWIPYYRVITGEVAPETFRGRIVLVGATSPTLHDVFPTPFAPLGAMPGVEIHANVLETLVQGDPLRRVPLGVTLAVALAAALLTAWVAAPGRPFVALATVTGLVGLHPVVAAAAFVAGDVWLDLLPLPLAVTLAYGVSVLRNFLEAQRARQRLSRFFSPAVLREVARHGHELGRTRRLVTVLFSDIRGFTTIAERLQPEEVAELLRDYMTSMTEAVFRHGGTVTQFVGDEIMALYNAPFDQPDHAIQAVRTALEFQERLQALSGRWAARCGGPLRNGVGIHTGEAMVGIVGSAQRVEYGAIGDTINLGSRLEGLTKEFGAPIIVSEATYQAVKDLVACRFLGEVTVKGKEVPVRIYGVEPGGRARALRVVLQSPLTITDLHAEFRVSVQASLADLSLTGVRATDIPRELAVDQLVALRFELPGVPRPLTAEGRVMWSADSQAGIRFLQLPPEDEALLEDFLRAREGSPR